MVTFLNLVEQDNKVVNTLDKIKKLKLKGNISIKFVKVSDKIENHLKQYEASRILILEGYSKKENDKSVLIDNDYIFDSDEDKIKAINEIQILQKTELLDLTGILEESIFYDIEIEGELIKDLGELVKYN